MIAEKPAQLAKPITADVNQRRQSSAATAGLESTLTMIVHSSDYVEYCRETALQLHDLHDLALRGRGQKRITHAVCQRIIDEVDLGPGDDLVDIGCGDGTLLRMAIQAGAHSARGLQATAEEAQLLCDLGLPVLQALSHSLPVGTASASVVVCNSVLLVIPTTLIQPTLLEISRIAKPGARVFLGEIPMVPGPEAEPHFASEWQALAYAYQKHGLRSWAGMLRRMARSKWTGEPLVVHDCSSIAFHAQADEFVAMVEKVGLTLVRFWQHEYVKNRNNYLFRKPASTGL
ncbi:MAG TPA: class I SAM-dependent methyltransferase [Terriglobales bacterium]|nr:class I SAM-dependent methyltransferase [Terriglobales bacterium]